MKEQELEQKIRLLLARKKGIALDDVAMDEIEKYRLMLKNKMSSSASSRFVAVAFEEMVLNRPDKLAVVTDTGIELTYAGLNARVNGLARQLMTYAERPMIGIFLDNGLDQLIALLASIKAGSPFVLLSPYESSHYQQTAQTILSIDGVITRQSYLDKQHLNPAWVITLPEDDRQSSSVENPDNYPDLYQRACIFPSGDRWVEIHYAALSYRVQYLEQAFPLTVSDIVYCSNRLGRDSFVVTVLWVLLQGSTIFIPTKANPAKPNQALTVAQLEPGEILPFIEHSSLPDLRQIICSHAPLKNQLVQRIRQHVDSQLIYYYSCPETGPLFQPYLCTGEEEREYCPIGYATKNTFLLNQKGFPVPEGMIGDLYCYAEGLASRYLNSSVVLECVNFSTTKQNQFKLAERAFVNKDGSITAIASHDKRAWVCGMLIDLVFIELQLRLNRMVKDCSIFARNNDLGRPCLVAYIVSAQETSEEILNAHLSRFISVDLLPEAYVSVSHIPRDQNGRVNESLLFSIPVLTDVLLKTKEAEIANLSGRQELAIDLAWKHQVMDKLHLTELLSHELCEALCETTLPASNVSYCEISQEPDFSAREDAILKGDELAPHQAGPKTITDAIKRAATEFAHKGIYFIGEGLRPSFISYGDLYQKARHFASGLRLHGLKPKDSVILHTQASVDYFACLWACILTGIIPATVAVAPTYGEKNSLVLKLFHTWNLLNQPPILTTHDLLPELDKLSGLFNIPAVAGIALETLGHAELMNDFAYQSTVDDVVFYQLTSGSTGVPKCIQETHRGIIQHIQAATQFNHYCADDISLNWLQADHVVPILTCHFKDTYLGCTQLHVKTEVIIAEPLRWFDCIESYRVTHTWTPNFGFKLVSEALKKEAHRAWDLSSIRFIMNAGEQITAAVLEEFISYTERYGIQERMIQPAFGMAEACTCMTYKNDFSISGAVLHPLKTSLLTDLVFAEQSSNDTIDFVTSGKLVPGVEIRITDEQNQTIRQGRIGRFQIRGAVITPGYLHNDLANKEAFVGDGWFNTGDLGFIYKDELYITGREKEVIIVRGASFHCYEIEDFVSTLAGVKPTFVAVCAAMNPKSGTEGFLVFFVPIRECVGIDRANLIQDINREVTKKFGVNPSRVIPLALEVFPKTTSGKIQRSALKKSYEQGEFNALQIELDLEMENDRVIPDWFYQKLWHQQKLPAVKRVSSQTILIFADQDGLADMLARQLESLGNSCILVSQGTVFHRHHSRHFTMNVADRQDYLRLFDELSQQALTIHEVLNLLPFCQHKHQDSSVQTIEWHIRHAHYMLHLLYALDRYSFKDALSIRIIGHSIFQVLERDIIALGLASLAGFCKTVEQELSWAKCQLVDLVSDSLEECKESVLAELKYAHWDAEIAYRGGDRWVNTLEKVKTLQQAQPPVEPFKRGGFYLISGGLGGIGLELGKFLLEFYHCKLLILGRRSKAEVSDLLKGLENLPGQVEYAAVDICHAETLRQAVTEVQTQFNASLDGVIHLAGLSRSRAIIDELAEDFSSIVMPKLLGAYHLFQLVHQRPDALFIVFSSVNAYFGGYQHAAYAAANSAVEAFVASIQPQHPNSYCMAWSFWDDVGMSAGHAMKQLAQAKGFLPITKAQGLSSLLVVLNSNITNGVIGINSKKLPIAYLVRDDFYFPRELHCYYLKAAEGSFYQRVHGKPLYDLYGKPSYFKLIPMTDLLFDEQGYLDKRVLMNPGNLIGYDGNEPQTEAELLLAKLFKKILKLNHVLRQDNFFQLGGNSLSATQLVAAIREHFGIDLPLSALFVTPELAGLARQLTLDSKTKDAQESFEPIKIVDRKQRLALSFSQERLWFLHQVNPNTSYYNITEAVKLSGSLDQEALAYAFMKLVERHEVLRTVFIAVDGLPEQLIMDRPNHFFDFVDLRTVESAQKEKIVSDFLQQEAHFKFDLLAGPLLKATLLALEADSFILILNMHHIIADAWSITLFLRDLAALYAEKLQGHSSQLPTLGIQYADFAAWQRQLMQENKLVEQLNYWTNSLAGYRGYLSFPADKPRPQLPSFAGQQLEVNIPTLLKDKLERIASQHQSTLFMVLFSAFNLLVAKYSGEDDLVMGIPIANRMHPEVYELIGFFVNTLAIRVDLSADPCFSQLLEQVKETSLQAYANQDIPFEQVVDALNITRTTDRHPLFQIVFVMQNVPETELALGNLEIELLPFKKDISKFDMTLSFIEKKDYLKGTLEYSVDLFAPETMARLMEHWLFLLHAITENPELRLSEFSLADSAYVSQAIHDFSEINYHPLLSSTTFFRGLQQLHPNLDSFAELLPNQRDLYIHYLTSDDKSLYTIAYCIDLGEKIDQKKWYESLSAAHHATGILQSRFFSLTNVFYQMIDSQLVFDYAFHSEQSLASVISSELSKPFNLFVNAVRHLLVKEPGGNYHAVLLCHHIICDAYSARLFFENVLSGYDVTARFKQNSAANYRLLTKNGNLSFDTPQLLARWQLELASTAIVPVKNNEQDEPWVDRDRINAAHLQQIQAYCSAKKISCASYLKAIIGLLLYRYYNMADDFVVLDVLNGRDSVEHQGIGCFYRTIPLVFKQAFFTSHFSDLLQQLSVWKKSLSGFKAFSTLEQHRLLKDHEVKIYINYYHFTQLQCGEETYSLAVHENFAKNEVHFILDEKPDGIDLMLCRQKKYAYLTDLLPRMIWLSQQILEGIERISELSLFLSAEKLKLDSYQIARKPCKKQDSFKPIHQFFEQQAICQPDAIAVVFANQQLSYSELNRRADKLAALLQQTAVQTEDIVAVCLDRSLDVIIAILGILKAGAAYLPLDPSNPTDRLAYILSDSQTKCLISEKSIVAKHQFSVEQLVYLDLLDELEEMPAQVSPHHRIILPEHLAYVIYTSGSTGQPKGVLIEHGNLARLFTSTQDLFHFDSHDVWTLFHSFAFDFSVWELWGALAYGGKLVIVPYETSRSPDDFCDLLCREQVTVLNQTPTAFSQLISFLEQRAMQFDHRLRYVIFGGEALDRTSLQPWLEHYGYDKPQLINMYGITEITVHATYQRLAASDKYLESRSNIGKPIQDLNIFILDQHQQLTPLGMIGELYVSGEGVGRGYLNRPDLDRARFIKALPYLPGGAKLYRTGDLGRYLPDGSIDYLGRMDDQVKIRGFRIELSEIAQQIKLIIGASTETVVLARQVEQELALVAYVLLPNELLDSMDIKRRLRQRLPEYMIPHYFISLDTFPLTINGKLDSKALPLPHQGIATRTYHPPSSPMQELIAAVWSQVLQLETVSVSDNFYDLGGHSLKLVQVHSLLNERLSSLEISVEIVALFQYPTIASLAEYLEQQCAEQSSSTLKNSQQRAEKRKVLRRKTRSKEHEVG